MKGVKYLFDKEGKPEVVIIDLKKNLRLWEDFHDLLVAEQRREEPREDFDQVKAMLKGKRRGNGKK